MEGLATQLTAPSSIAFIAADAPFAVKVDIMTTAAVATA